MVELNITSENLETVLEALDVARNKFRETNKEKFRCMTALLMDLAEIYNDTAP